MFYIKCLSPFLYKILSFTLAYKNKLSIMKKTILLFVCMLLTFCGFAKTANSRDIHLRARDADQEALRSILPVRAILDGNIIQIEFFDSPENAIVTITDADGVDIVTGTYSSPGLVRLRVSQVSNEYAIEIAYGEVYLYGNFIIE